MLHSIAKLLKKSTLFLKTPRKTGVYRGIHYFLIFALKHILWVRVRTASMRQNIKIVKKNQLKIGIFTAVKNRCILHGRVFVMYSASPISY